MTTNESRMTGVFGGVIVFLLIATIALLVTTGNAHRRLDRTNERIDCLQTEVTRLLTTQEPKP